MKMQIRTSEQTDMSTFFDTIIAEHSNQFIHTDEGSDDMPAHAKTSVYHGRNIPIFNGTWQGLWLNEHRNFGGSRKILVTINGE